MKKVVAALACVMVLLVGYIVLDKSGTESPSFDAKKACDAGDMRGCHDLGVMYADGNGVEKDFKKAAELFKKACDGGVVFDCSTLGAMYVKGNGVEKDFKKAV